MVFHRKPANLLPFLQDHSSSDHSILELLRQKIRFIPVEIIPN